MTPEILRYLPHTVQDIVQIVVIWVVIYLALRLVRGTIAGSILRGAVLVVAVAVVVAAVVVRVFELRVLEQILAALGNVAVLAMLVVFQPELRRALLSLGEGRLLGGLRRRELGAVDEVSRAALDLSRRRYGALFAIERAHRLHHITQTGVSMDCEARAETLATLFWPNSPLHDGGAVIRGDRVIAAACIFPLAERRELASTLGTRHRAALGLSEESDAVVVVVSEETGRISVAALGELRVIDPPSDLSRILRAALDLPPPGPPEDAGDETSPQAAARDRAGAAP